MSEENEKPIVVAGILHQLSDTQTFASGFSKREFVLEVAGKYPQCIKMEVLKDACSLLDDVSIGTMIKASINIRGNEYQGKYYVNLQAWRLEIEKPYSSSQATTEKPCSSSQDIGFNPDADDIPF